MHLQNIKNKRKEETKINIKLLRLVLVFIQLKKENPCKSRTYKGFSRGGRIRTCDLRVPNAAR